MNPKSVLVTVPHTGMLRAELVGFLLNVVTRNAKQDKIRVSVDLCWGMPVDSTRNTIVQKFLKTENEWLMMIDSDIEPPPYALEQLLSHGEKVVSAVCWSSMRGEGDMARFNIPYPVVMKRNPKGGWNVDRDALQSGKRLIECDAGSTACLLVHRDVFSALNPPFFRLIYDKDGVCVGGEDFTFFERLRMRGFKVYVDTSVQCEHYKTLEIKRFNDLLAQTERMERNKQCQKI